jgi:hypothetical protein
MLAKLLHENRENLASDVHKQLLKKLNGMRYSRADSTSAQQPKKKDKLLPGASYTCTPGAPIVAPAVVVDDVDDPAVQVARSSRHIPPPEILSIRRRIPAAEANQRTPADPSQSGAGW